MNEDPPPDEPESPKRLSFREANLGPEKELEPTPKPHAEPFFTKRKRSVGIGLVAFGAGAAAVYGISQANHRDCARLPVEQQATCNQGGHGGGGSSWWGHSGGGSSEASSTSRGGFGAMGAAHGGGGE